MRVSEGVGHLGLEHNIHQDDGCGGFWRIEVYTSHRVWLLRTMEDFTSYTRLEIARGDSN